MSLRSVLATMTYKPTFHFEVVDVNGSDVLRVTMATHDSRPDDAPPLSVPVDFGVPTIVPGWPDDEWRVWLRDKVHWCELHESDEWLRFDGVLVFDPHERTMHR
jgi:hypothetical protein